MKNKQKGTCANSNAPDKSMERKIADVVIRECDVKEDPDEDAENADTPYRNIAKYRMVSTSDEDSFDCQRS